MVSAALGVVLAVVVVGRTGMDAGAVGVVPALGLGGDARAAVGEGRGRCK